MTQTVMTMIVTLLTVLVSLNPGAQVVNGWFFGTLKVDSNDQSTSSAEKVSYVKADTVASPAVRSSVPFEMKTMDEQFLIEATRTLSPLDACHHRVVAELEGTCGDVGGGDSESLGASAQLSVRS